MLDLNARIHLHEIEAAILIEQEFDRARILITRCTYCLDGCNAHGTTSFAIERRRRRFFQQLLMTALERAIAFAQRNAVIVLISQDLNLDMAWTQHELLQIDIAIAKGCERFGLCGSELALQLFRAVHFAHALAAAARACLDEDRIARSIRECARFLDRFHDAIGARDGGNAAGLHGLTSLRLVAHRFDALWRRADEHDVVVGARTCKIGVLSQETIAGMNRIGASVDSSSDDRRDDKIALISRSGTDADGLISIGDRCRIGIFGGIDRHRLHAQFLAGAHDAQSDLASVCD